MIQETHPSGLTFLEEESRSLSSQKVDSRSANKRKETIVVTIVVFVVALIAIPFLKAILALAYLPSWMAYLPLLASGLFMLFAWLFRRDDSAETVPRSYRPSIFRPAKQPSPESAEHDFLTLLGSILNDNWQVYHNVPIPGFVKEIDALLVGPTGVYVLGINTDKGNYRLREGLWEWQDWHNRWRVDPKNPLTELDQKRHAINAYLKTKAINGRLQSRLVWAGEGHLSLPKNYEDVWFTADDGDQIWRDINRGHLLSEETIAQLNREISNILGKR